MSPEISEPRHRKHRRPTNKAEAITAALTGVAALTGAVVPDADRMAPQVSLSMPLLAIARALGQILRNENLFRWVTGSITTVNPATGEAEPMTAYRFPTWSQEHITFVRETAQGVREVSLTVDLARLIMASDAFRGALRPLLAINFVRLPFWANPERTRIELLPVGYHEGEAVFTIDSCPYDLDLLEDSGRFFLLDFLREFPFARPVDERDQPLEKNRSFSVHIGSMMTSYGRHLFNGILRPPFIYRANQRGSGKTLLAKLGISPSERIAAVKALPRDEAELGKLLTSLVGEGRHSVIFDNVKHKIESQELEAFLTSTQRIDRILGKNAIVTAANNLQVVITGNSLELSTDMGRRALLCDLFSAPMVSERKLSNPIDESALAKPEIRGRLLAALWSLVRYWSDKGCPRSKGATLPTFEEFASIIGGLVTTCLFADPIAKSDVILDVVEQGWIELIKLLAEPIANGGFAEYSPEEVLEKAKDAGLHNVILGDSRALKAPEVAIGKRITQWFGREFHDASGRLFEFGKRHAKPGAKYGVRILTPEDSAPESDE